MELAAVRDAVFAQFAAFPVEEEPFPHLIGRDVFPEPFYRALRANLPADAAMDPPESRQLSNPYAVHRSRFSVNPEGLARLDEEPRRFWQSVHTMLCSRDFLDLVIGRFALGVARRYRGNPLDPVGRLEVVVDRRNYAIRPHTDSEGKIATLLFYLPADASRVDLGTAIFTPKERGFVSESAHQFPFERFDKVKAAPYVPNSCLAFLKTDNSFHGREVVEGPEVRRPMMFLTILHRTRASGTAGRGAAM